MIGETIIHLQYTEMYPGFQKWGSFGPLLSELGGPSGILGGPIN